MDYKATDKNLFELLDLEAKRQEDFVSLIPSENYTSKPVRMALGSVCTNKYSEGYPEKRYYNGNIYIDQIENLAIDRTKQVFNAKFANVQPYSGSPANLAVYFSLLEPGDKVMGLKLSHGGHLTHGSAVNFSGKWFNQQSIEINEDNQIDYDQLEMSVRAFKPKLIIAGITSYPIELDYKTLAKIAHKHNSYLVADVSHTNGFVIAGLHQQPLDEGADILTTTTHKLLRGPRGAVICTNDSELAKKIDKAIMPGLQGGPHNHQTAAIAVAMSEALRPKYKKYVKNVSKNSKALTARLINNGAKLVANGTENHLAVLDVRPYNLNGRQAADLLEDSGIVVNANTIPHDPNPPYRPSGIRIGTPAVTTRNMTTVEMDLLSDMIVAVLTKKRKTSAVKSEIIELTNNFPIPEFF